jgi:tryptophanyl-tRNA synthetase
MHLGNYYGALRHQVALANDPKNYCLFFVADLHTLTTATDPEALRRDRESLVLDFLGSGLNPDSAVLYCQSSVPEITQLAWFLACLAPVAALQGMHHWKEKKDKLEGLGREANAGLLTYPVLMAADILGPKANIVPVGDDQRAHVEFARELARAFNSTFGVVFPEPQELVQEGGRVPGLQADGKMAKSGGSEKGTIFLTESVASALKKVKAAPHAPRGDSGKDFGDPTQCSIFTLHTIVSQPESIQWANVGCRAGTIGCNECKLRMFQHIEPLLEEIQERRAQYAAKGPKFVQELLHENGKVARKRFAQTLAEVQDKMGITPY